ncbi:MAG TPA: acyltransferase [Patescibacteria group bacterium]|nr:acyltransferase [Patescibacteria group bacterium]
MKRNTTIDLLRGIATVAMILIHTSYYFIGNDKLALFIWNWSQFAVPMFLFCAGYVFFLKTSNLIASKATIAIQQFYNYLRKRLPRLLVPYYIFLIFFLIVVLLTTPAKLTLNYFWQSIFLIGGVDINWLVLLMLELAILMPIILWLKTKYPLIFKLYIFFAILFSILIMFFPLSDLHWKLEIENWKLIQWFPWSLVEIAAIYFLPESKLIQRKILWLLSLIIFFVVYFVLIANHHDVSFINNKYPPDLLILSYGISAIGILYWAAQKNFFQKFSSFLSFISQHSYSIYFIHYCLLIYFATWLNKIHTTWYLFFLIVFLPTLFIQYTWGKSRS